MVLVQFCRGQEYCKPKGLSSRRGTLWHPNGVVATFLAFPIAFPQRLGMSELQCLTKKEKSSFPRETTQQDSKGRERGRELLCLFGFWIVRGQCIWAPCLLNSWVALCFHVFQICEGLFSCTHVQPDLVFLTTMASGVVLQLPEYGCGLNNPHGDSLLIGGTGYPSVTNLKAAQYSP